MTGKGVSEVDQQLRLQVWTIPNGISLLRFFCIPIFATLLLNDSYAAATLLLAVLGATDWVDGVIARRWHQVSRFGQFFDPFADRILLLVAASLLMLRDIVPLSLALLALGREAIIVVVGAWLATRRIAGLPVSFVGKTGAFALMFAFPSFLAASAWPRYVSEFRAFGWCCGVIGVAFSWASLWGYAQAIRRVNCSDIRS